MVEIDLLLNVPVSSTNFKKIRKIFNDDIFQVMYQESPRLVI